MHARTKLGLPLAAICLLANVLACGRDDDRASGHDHHPGHGMPPQADGVHAHAALLPNVMTTHRAVVDGGLWSNPSTWSPKEVPGDGHHVLIPPDITVSVASVVPGQLELVRVRGTLRFEPGTDTSLTVETIEVAPEGRLQIGDPANPVRGASQATIVFADSGKDVTPNQHDPEALRRGLVAYGEVKLYGGRKDAFTTLVGNALTGATTLSLETTPNGWRKGDRIMISSTHFGTSDALQNEVRTISDVGTNTIAFDEGLAFDHRIDPKMRIHVANLTRNIVFTSANGATTRRGHVMVMKCDGSVIEGTRFENLGRTDKRQVIDDPVILGGAAGTNPRGRYSLHFHHCGLDTGAGLVRNSVVEGTPGWGMAVHGSRVAFIDNVVYDFVGAGFVAEDGNELSTFRGNLAAGGRGNGQFRLRRVYLDQRDRLQVADFGFHGDGFWLQSPFVQVEDNVAAGNKGVGFFYHCAGVNQNGGVGLPDAYAQELGLGGLLSVVRRWGSSTEPLIVDLPIVRFSGNSAYGNFIGLKVRYSQSASNAVFNVLDATLADDIVGTRTAESYAPYTIESSSFWNNFVGVHTSYTQRGTFHGLFIGTNMAPPSSTLDRDTWVGYEGWKATGTLMAVDGVAVKGYPVGLLLETPTATRVANVTYRDVAVPVAYNKSSSIR